MNIHRFVALLCAIAIGGCAFFEVPVFPQHKVQCTRDPGYWTKVQEPRRGKVEWKAVDWKSLQDICRPWKGYKKGHSATACIFPIHNSAAEDSVVFSWLTREQAKEWITPQCETVEEHEYKHHRGYAHD